MSARPLVMSMPCFLAIGIFAGSVAPCSAQPRHLEDPNHPGAAIVPVLETIHPFNGTDLSGFTTWLQATGPNDPQKDYRAADGMMQISGRGMGYLATVNEYRNYHLSVEYKWGERSDGSGNVRNSGILLHATGPPGNARGIWMASVECQLAQGCEGDIICIRGRDDDDRIIPVTLSSDTRIAEDGRTRWQKGGLKTSYAGKQFWWSKHEVGFKEVLDARGSHDVASPLGEWTKVECICDGDRITLKVNGTIVNECYDVYPAAGRILLENEKNEIHFRNLELRPLQHRNRRTYKDSTTDREPDS